MERCEAGDAVVWAGFVGAAAVTIHLVVMDFGSLYRFGRAIGTLCMIVARYRRAPRDVNGLVDRGVHAECATMLADLLVEFGGIWAKIGQFTALRSDLAPPEYARELSRCQDQLPPRPFSQVRETIERELGCKLDSVFEWVDEECISSATIAQVHRGRLRHGPIRDVAIKVQHKDVSSRMAKDLRLVEFLHWLVMALFPWLNAVKVCTLYLRFTRKELDFTSEAANMEKIRENLSHSGTLRPGFVTPFTRPLREWDLADLKRGTEVLVRFDPTDSNSPFLPGQFLQCVPDTEDQVLVVFSGSTFELTRNIDDVFLHGDDLYIDIKIPSVVKRLCTRRLLVMSFEDGKVSKRADFVGADQECLYNQAIMIARAFTHMAFIDGFVHGDPHPANVMYQSTSPPVILDFGLCMALDERIVRGWCKVIYGSTQLDLGTLCDGFRDLGFEPLPGDARSEEEQIYALSETLFPGRRSDTESVPASHIEELDRAKIMRAFFAHKLDSPDLLFIVRVSNYLANLCSKFDLRAIFGVYPLFAESSIRRHKWAELDT